MPPAVSRRFSLSRGQTLRADTLSRSSMFVIRSGCAKACVDDAQGTPHIVRFLLPGDVVGLDAMAPNGAAVDIIALETCDVCEIPASRAEKLADFSTTIGAHLRRLLARELASSQQHAADLAHLRAGERIAAFLLRFADRLSERGRNGLVFRLPMRRREIGEHLSLTTETVSRTLHAFARRGWIVLIHGGVEIKDRDALARLVSKKAN